MHIRTRLPSADYFIYYYSALIIPSQRILYQCWDHLVPMYQVIPTYLRKNKCFFVLSINQISFPCYTKTVPFDILCPHREPGPQEGNKADLEPIAHLGL